MNLNQIRKAAQKLIEEGNLVLGALEIIEQQMASVPPRNIPRSKKPYTEAQLGGALPDSNADGQFTLAAFAQDHPDMTKMQARTALNALVAEGKFAVVQKGKGRRPTLYKEVTS